MLKLSRLADYGVVLVTRMAVARDEVHTAQSMADATRLPLPTVSKLLSALARAQLLVGLRGSKGGFRLARHPRHVSVADIIAAVDGPVALTQCLENGPGSCDVELFCPSRSGWKAINEAVWSALSGVTVADLIDPAPTPHALWNRNSEGMHQSGTG